MEKRQVRKERHLNCKHDDTTGMVEVEKYKSIFLAVLNLRSKEKLQTLVIKTFNNKF